MCVCRKARRDLGFRVQGRLILSTATVRHKVCVCVCQSYVTVPLLVDSALHFSVHSVYPQCNGSNVMHFSFTLLRIKDLYMFRTLVAHPQEVMYVAFGILRVYNARWHGSSFTATVPHPSDIIRTQYAKCRLYSASWGWESNVRNMQRPLILNKIEWKVRHIGFMTLIYYDARPAKHSVCQCILLHKFRVCVMLWTSFALIPPPFASSDTGALNVFNFLNRRSKIYGCRQLRVLYLVSTLALRNDMF
jgi:hypothetical protein